MNQYGTRAREHWKRVRPQEYQTLLDPERFFQELGEEAARQVDELTDHLTRQQPAAEAYLDEVARRTTGRRQAEERVLAELILLPPEPTHPDAEPEEEPEHDLMVTSWAPLQEENPPRR